MKALAVACALTAPVLASANEPGQWYVVPQIGGISVDNDRPVEDKNWLYGLAIGKHLNSVLSLELNLNGSQLDGGLGASDLSLYGASLDLVGALNRSGRVAPYLSVGLGAVENDFSPGRGDTHFMTQAGVGLMVKVWESADSSRSFSLRPDLKARWDDAGSQGHLLDYIGTLGFQYSFGSAKPAPAPEPEPEPEPAPSPPPPVPAAPPPPADTDGDGVTDDLDKCPDTPSGVAVDAYGCTRKGSITLEGVGFEHDSDVLTPNSRAILAGLAADLQKYPRLRIELQGHTDSTGPDEYNMRLSQRRAEAVQAFLIEQGVSPDQLTARGFGESQPVADNATAEGRARNRRVVMSVLENPGDVEVSGEGGFQQ
ncbi:MAG: hypothetical protein DIU71_14720 [Proteobacteria bacterium]|nr:MAG: hypothetical protein DIU71_14720 [Pseudomonadota bacterium]